MLIIGEQINSSKEKIKRAVDEKDAAFIQDIARRQVDAGANMLDVNCGTSLEKEPEDLVWLVKTVQEKVDVPLCIDSPNPDAISKALPLHKGKALVNSITLEKSRYEKVLPLVKKHNASLVALTIDEKGIPETAEERLDIAKKIFEIVKAHRIDKEDLYFDPTVKPISSSPVQAKEFIKSVRLIKSLGFKVIGGLSNISFGLPERSLLNSTFLVMARAAGLDAAILDPLNKRVSGALCVSDVILGEDNYCKNYITAFRDGKLSI